MPYLYLTPLHGVHTCFLQSLLPHLPSPCSIGYALSHCVEITGAPKKSLLRMMAEHCSDPAEKRTLVFFTSRAGETSQLEGERSLRKCDPGRSAGDAMASPAGGGIGQTCA